MEWSGQHGCRSNGPLNQAWLGWPLRNAAIGPQDGGMESGDVGVADLQSPK